jgi:hypothetical protein
MSEVKTLNILNNVYENINNLELLNSLKIISQKIEKFDNASDLAAKALADKAIADKSASDAKIAADKAIEDAKKTNVNINQVWDENEKKLKEAKEKDTKDEKNKKIVPSNVEPKINTEEYVKWIFVAFAIFIAILMIFSFIYYIFFYNSNVPQNDENYNSIINNDNNLYNSNNSSSINNQYNQFNKLSNYGFNVVNYISNIDIDFNNLSLILIERKLNSIYEAFKNALILKIIINMH